MTSMSRKQMKKTTISLFRNNYINSIYKMQEAKKEIETKLKSNRPNLSASSVNTYTIILASIYRKCFPSEDFNIHKFSTEADKIIEHLKDTTPSTRKTKLACLFVLSKNDKYHTQMLHDIGSYNDDLSKQEKNDKQTASWVNTDQLKDKYNELKHTADLLYKKQSHTANDLSQIQDYILMCLYSNAFIPPRRLLDYTNFKMREIDPEKDNYMDKNTFVFNAYKTAKVYGKQTVVIPVQLRNILNKWNKLSGNDYLLFDKAGKALTNVKLNQRLKAILGNNSSVNAIRHGVLTDMFAPDIEMQNKMKATATAMGTSASTIQQQYLKKEN